MKFALDVFESIKALPGSSVLWRNLFGRARALAPQDRDALIAEIARFEPADPAADWLRCSALHFLTGDMTWMARQSRLADERTPIDALMDLLDCAWMSALSNARSRTDLARMVKDLELPRLQRLAARNLGQVPAAVRAAHATSAKALRIALYTPQLSNPRHGGTLFTLNIASVLCALSDTVGVVTAQESDIPNRTAYCGADVTVKPLTLVPDEIKIHARRRMPVQLVATGHSVRHKMHAAVATIREFKPDLVVFVGFLSPVVYELWKHYPVIGLSTNTLPPVAPIDVWLSASPDEPSQAWPELPAALPHRFPYRFWPKGAVTPEDRAALGVPVEAIVLITAGFRLPAECVPPWSDQVLAFLDHHPNVWWVLLGAKPEALEPRLRAHPRVLAVPPRRDAASCYAMSDIYLNPPRIGGGGSVAEAMEQGLPVVSLGGCDGGDKIADLAATSIEECLARLTEWVRDPVARRAAGQALQKRFHAQYNMASPDATKALRQAAELALARFRERTAG